MNLNIDRLVTRCQVPKGSVTAWQSLDRLAREQFPLECRREILAHLPAQPEVIRIRRLLIQLRVSGQFDGQRLARAWSEAFARALLAAINSSKPENEVVQARTRTEWLARFVLDVLSGSALSRWEYEEFNEALRLGAANCVLTVLSHEPWEIVHVLLLVDDRKRLDQLLLLFDDLALEKLFSLLAHEIDEETSEPTVDDLLKIGALVTSQTSTRVGLATRQRALSIFLALSRTRAVGSDRVITPRLVLHALMALDALLELNQSLPPESWFHALAPESLARREGPSLHPMVLELVAKVWTLAAEMGAKVQNQKLDSLSQLLFELSPLPVITSSAAEKRAHWVSSECAGVLLLVGLLDRLGWVQRIRTSSVGLRIESRATNFCLAALALRLLGPSPESDRLDPGLLLFAGWPEPASADLAGLRKFLMTLSEIEQEELVDLLTDSEERKLASGWITTFDHLANDLIREFSSRLRGFRDAKPSFVIKTFISQPGRIFIDDKRILVILQSNPFHIALHISSMDEAVESVSWLAGRRLDFQLQDL
jgi:hypothetical protein